jgi:8-oxo-dGTP diphosphatase
MAQGNTGAGNDFEVNMARIKHRRRGTAIVETPHGILLTGGYTAGRRKPFILPGGGAERGESRFVAAMRELTEETGLLPYEAKIIFRHHGKPRPTMSGEGLFQDEHTVCLVKATGHPKPGGGDAKRIAYYYPGCSVWISTTTKEIIERYYEWRKRKQASDASEITDEDDSNPEDEELGKTDDYDTAEETGNDT